MAGEHLRPVLGMNGRQIPHAAQDGRQRDGKGTLILWLPRAGKRGAGDERWPP